MSSQLHTASATEPTAVIVVESAFSRLHMQSAQTTHVQNYDRSEVTTTSTRHRDGVETVSEIVTWPDGRVRIHELVKNMASGKTSKYAAVAQMQVSVLYLDEHRKYFNTYTEYQRIGLAAGVMKRLDRVRNQTNLTYRRKFVYISHVCWRYGSETWTLTQPDWRRLDSFHTRCQRRILHIRWYDYITNDEVLRRTGLLTASSIVRK